MLLLFVGIILRPQAPFTLIPVYSIIASETSHTVNRSSVFQSYELPDGIYRLAISQHATYRPTTALAREGTLRRYLHHAFQSLLHDSRNLTSTFTGSLKRKYQSLVWRRRQGLGYIIGRMFMTRWRLGLTFSQCVSTY